MWKIEKLGQIDYLKSLEYQNKIVDSKRNGEKDNFFLLLEHNPVFTTGKCVDQSNILDKNINVIKTNRGGDLTYHGPGQLVGYIIYDLKASKYDVHIFLRNLEQIIIDTLYEFNLKAYRISGLTGVWVGEKKLASIGIGVKRGISMHGLALNVCPDLTCFKKINPCGLDAELISSVKELKKSDISVENVQNIMIEKFIRIFGEV